MHRIESYARILLVIAITIGWLTALIVPSLAPFADAALAVVIALCAIGIIVGPLFGGTMRISNASLIALPLFFVSLISSLTASDIRFALLGSSTEVGTAASFGLAAILLIAGATASEMQVRAFLASIAVAGAILGACAALFSFGSAAFSFAAAGYPEFGIVFAAATVAALYLSYESVSDHGRIAWQIAAFFSALGSMILFSAAVSIAYMLVICVFFMRGLRFRSRDRKERLPAGAVVVALAYVLAFMLGLAAPHAAVPSEIRPTPSASAEVILPIDLSSPRATLIGSGMGAYAAAWEQYRPPEWNALPFWNETPSHAYDTLYDVAFALGLFGVIAYLALPAVGLYAVFRRSHEFVPLAEPAAVIGLTGFALSVLYPISLGTLLVSCFLLGAAFKWLPMNFLSIRKRTAVPIVVFVISLCLVFAACAMRESLSALRAVRSPTAIGLEAALASWPSTDLILRTEAAYVEKASADTAAGSPDAAANDLVKAESLLDQAVTRTDARVWIAKGSVDLALLKSGKNDARKEAVSALTQAPIFAPNRPDVPYLMALLDQADGDSAGARRELEAALALKPDYTAALNLLSSLGQ